MADTLTYRSFPPKLVAGALSLDFVNTVEWRGDAERRIERLTGYDELLLWCRAAGVLDDDGAEQRRAEAERRPAAAADVVQQAIAARELLADLLAGQPGFRTLSEFNWLLGRIPRSAVLKADGDGFAWRYDSGDRLNDVLWPVLWDAAALLTGDSLGKVGHCHNDICGWFFIDHSRNRSRRWCSMDSCGNRAKARRHYARNRAGSDAENSSRVDG